MASVPRMPCSRVLLDGCQSSRAGLPGRGLLPVVVFRQRLCLVRLDYEGHRPRCPLLCSQVANPFFVQRHRIGLARQLVVSSCQEQSGRRAAEVRQRIAPLQPPKPNRPATGNTRSGHLPRCHDPPGWPRQHRQSTDRQMIVPP